MGIVVAGTTNTTIGLSIYSSNTRKKQYDWTILLYYYDSIIMHEYMEVANNVEMQIIPLPVEIPELVVGGNSDPVVVDCGGGAVLGINIVPTGTKMGDVDG